MDPTTHQQIRACEARHAVHLAVQNEKHDKVLATIRNAEQATDGHQDDADLIRLARIGAGTEHGAAMDRIQRAMVREAGRIALGWWRP